MIVNDDCVAFIQSINKFVIHDTTVIPEVAEANHDNERDNGAESTSLSPTISNDDGLSDYFPVKIIATLTGGIPNGVGDNDAHANRNTSKNGTKGKVQNVNQNDHENENPNHQNQKENQKENHKQNQNSYKFYKNILHILSADEELFHLNFNIKRDIEFSNSSTIVSAHDKLLIDKIYELLHKEFMQGGSRSAFNSNHLALSFNYEQCISHPGNIFVKNLSTNLISVTVLQDFFNAHSIYKSLNTVKIFPQDNNESFAFLNFSNHLDADHLMADYENFESNPFHLDQERKLYINRYISRRERKLRQQGNDQSQSQNLNQNNTAEVDVHLAGLSLRSASASPTTISPINDHSSSNHQKKVQHQNSNGSIATQSSLGGSSSTATNSHDYSTIFIENLGLFITDINPSVEFLDSIVSKFETFGKISSVFFPLVPCEEEDFGSGFKLGDFGYINYEFNTNDINSLKSLYYLSDLSSLEFFKFAESDIYDLKNDMISIEKKMEFEENNQSEQISGSETDVFETEPFELGEATSINNSLTSEFSGSPVKLQLSIGQHKHNHHLYFFTPGQYAYTRGTKGSSIELMCPELHSSIMTCFLKKSNYQETNIYVNNFPMIFKNDDELWESFWVQFGNPSKESNGIKSARIIKPQFYSKTSSSADLQSQSPNQSLLGKIGFVFYLEFKMALRAVLLTNNKTISMNGDEEAINIQTSFAIQKSNGQNHSNHHNGIPTSSSFANPRSHHSPVHVDYAKRFSLPNLLPKAIGTASPSMVAAAAAVHQQHPFAWGSPYGHGMHGEFPGYFFNPYANFSYGYPGFIPNRMSFEQEQAPGEDSESSGVLSPSPHSLPHVPKVSNFPQYYTGDEAGFPPSQLVYSQQQHMGMAPPMMPFYAFYGPSSVPQANGKANGKKVKQRSKE